MVRCNQRKGWEKIRADFTLPCVGDSFVTFTFETGNSAYKELQNGTYVAAGHFVVDKNEKGLIVEYKVSKVTA